MSRKRRAPAHTGRRLTCAGDTSVSAPRRPWLAVVSVGCAALILVTTEFVPVGLLPAMAQAFGVTEGRAGLLVTIPGLVAAATAPLAPIVCARIDRRLVLLALTSLLGASNAVVAVSTTFWGAAAGRVLLGIGVGGFWAIGGALGPRLIPGPQSVRATGLILSGIAVGTVAGVPAGTFIGNHFGWKLAFWTTGAVAAIVLLAQWWFLPSLPMENATTGRDLRRILARGATQVGLAATVLSFAGHFSAYTYVAALLQHGTGLSSDITALLLFVFGIGTIAGTIAGSALIAAEVRPTLVIAVGIVGASIMVLAFAGASPLVAVLCVVLWGTGYGTLPLALQTWMFRACPEALEGVTCLYVCVAQISIGTGAFVGGTVFDMIGPFAPFGVGAVSALSAMVLLMRATDPSRGNG